jgi:hypothetical protein
MPAFVDQQIRFIGSFIPNLIAALLVLIIGYIVAKIISGAVRGLLRRTTLDNRLASSLGGTGIGAEGAISTAVFYLIMVFVLIGFFQALALTAVSEPLNELLAQVLAFLPRVLGAALMLFVAWVVATVLRRIVVTALSAAGIDRRLSSMVSDEEPAPAATASAGSPAATASSDTTTTPATRPATRGISLANTLGDVVYWLVFLFFLPGILGTLELGGILTPVTEMLNRIFGYLPNIVAAAIILLVGWFVARIVQRIVTGLLAAAGVDRLGQRVGLSQVLGGQTLSGLIGLVVYIFILVPVLISALNALAIEAITRPATNMLNTFMAAVPNIFAAAVVLGISFVVGRLVAGLVSNLLAGLGFNSLPARLGMTGGGPATVGSRTPAEIVGSLVMVAIMLFATVEAARLLGFAVLADLLAEFIGLGGQIILGLIIFGVGLYLANLAADMIRASGTTNAGLLAMAARMAIMVLAGAMALRQMGLANEIVNLAFGLLLGAIAVAAALAFGFGGRDIAGRELEQWVSRMKLRGAQNGVAQGGMGQRMGSMSPSTAPGASPARLPDGETEGTPGSPPVG